MLNLNLVVEAVWPYLISKLKTITMYKCWHGHLHINFPNYFFKTCIIYLRLLLEIIKLRFPFWENESKHVEDYPFPWLPLLMSYIHLPSNVIYSYFPLWLIPSPFWTLLAITMVLIMLLLWETIDSGHCLGLWFPIILFRSCTFKFETIDISCFYDVEVVLIYGTSVLV